MNEARLGHSSCILKDILYVFAGMDTRFNNYIESIEKVDASQWVANGGQNINW